MSINLNSSQVNDCRAVKCEFRGLLLLNISSRSAPQEVPESSAVQMALTMQIAAQAALGVSAVSTVLITPTAVKTVELGRIVAKQARDLSAVRMELTTRIVVTTVDPESFAAKMEPTTKIVANLALEHIAA